MAGATERYKEFAGGPRPKLERVFAAGARSSLPPCERATSSVVTTQPTSDVAAWHPHVHQGGFFTTRGRLGLWLQHTGRTLNGLDDDWLARPSDSRPSASASSAQARPIPAASGPAPPSRQSARLRPRPQQALPAVALCATRLRGSRGAQNPATSFSSARRTSPRRASPALELFLLERMRLDRCRPAAPRRVANRFTDQATDQGDKDQALEARRAAGVGVPGLPILPVMRRVSRTCDHPGQMREILRGRCLRRTSRSFEGSIREA